MTEPDWERALEISRELAKRAKFDDIRACWPEPDGCHACVIFTREDYLIGMRIALEYHPYEMGMTPEELVWRTFIDLDEPFDRARIERVSPDQHGVRWIGDCGNDPVPEVGRLMPPFPYDSARRPRLRPGTSWAAVD